MKMYFLLKMGIFQPAMLVYQDDDDYWSTLSGLKLPPDPAEQRTISHISNEKKTGCLGDLLVDDILPSYIGLFHKPLKCNLLNNQDSMERIRPGFFRGSNEGVVTLWLGTIPSILEDHPRTWIPWWSFSSPFRIGQCGSPFIHGLFKWLANRWGVILSTY